VAGMRRAGAGAALYRDCFASRWRALARNG